jgi:hypothetical protein
MDGTCAPGMPASVNVSGVISLLETFGTTTLNWRRAAFVPHALDYNPAERCIHVPVLPYTALPIMKLYR